MFGGRASKALTWIFRGWCLFSQNVQRYPPVHFHCKIRGLVFSKRLVLGGHCLVPHEGRAVAFFFSSKHFYAFFKGIFFPGC